MIRPRKTSPWQGKTGVTATPQQMCALCATCFKTYGQHMGAYCDPPGSPETVNGPRRVFRQHDLWTLEVRRTCSIIPAYRDWHTEPTLSKMTSEIAVLEKQQRERENGKAGWEYRLIPYFAPAPPVPVKRQPPAQTLALRPGSLRPALEEIDTDYLEVLATEAKAEAGRRALRAKEAAESAERERKALWMRVHGEAARQGFDNFMAGVVQAMASRAVLRWSKDHKPYGGSTPSSGESWTEEEIYEAEQLCYARGHVPPWHLDAGKAVSVLKAKAGIGPRIEKKLGWRATPWETPARPVYQRPVPTWSNEF